uniref:Uncharacterized protein n=1 Tax=Knipowitschia caucasica TaxID=637954 RepID=A0AAV2MIW7_KNICA
MQRGVLHSRRTDNSRVGRLCSVWPTSDAVHVPERSGNTAGENVCQGSSLEVAATLRYVRLTPLGRLRRDYLLPLLSQPLLSSGREHHQGPPLRRRRCLALD